MELHCKHILIWGSVLLSFRTTHQTMNVAPKGTAMQSESPDSASPAAAAPHLAIDQISSPQSYEETCTSVAQQNNPWWQVDLGSIYHITSVAVISNGDCCPEELDGAEIRIGLKNDTNNDRCAVIAFTQGLYKYNFDCEVMEARFVHVVLPGDGKTLTLCEVQVFGAVLENVAVKGVAFQSSLQSTSSGRASSVVDGNRITTCSITEDKPGQWVKVDLVDPYSVTVIQLAFLEDCCYSPDVWVDDTRCLVMSNSSLTLVTLDCGGVVGRIVTVNHPDVPLTLCEVEVYSTQEHPENTFPQRPARYSYCYPDMCSRDLVLVRQTMTWFEGQTYCREKHTDLATIHGAQDMNKVIDVMGMDVSDVWIGLYKDAGTWKWSDGNDTIFTHWGEGQPDNSEAGPNCAHFNGVLKAWSASSCDTKSMFFCYYNKEPQDTGLRKFTVRISTDFDMSDAVIQQQIIKQLEMKMKSKGMSDFKIRWGRTIDQNETE